MYIIINIIETYKIIEKMIYIYIFFLKRNKRNFNCINVLTLCIYSNYKFYSLYRESSFGTQYWMRNHTKGQLCHVLWVSLNIRPHSA